MPIASQSLPSQAVLEARARRAVGASEGVARVEWFIDEVSDKVAISLEKRVKIATELVKSKIVQNISRPVTKIRVRTSGGSYTKVRDRSKPGEFPKADTTLLMKTIFMDVKKAADGVFDGFVGTPLDYGVILELKMNRSFMVRTLNEEREKIARILSGPIG